MEKTFSAILLLLVSLQIVFCCDKPAITSGNGEFLTALNAAIQEYVGTQEYFEEYFNDEAPVAAADCTQGSWYYPTPSHGGTLCNIVGEGIIKFGYSFWNKDYHDWTTLFAQRIATSFSKAYGRSFTIQWVQTSDTWPYNLNDLNAGLYDALFDGVTKYYEENGQYRTRQANFSCGTDAVIAGAFAVSELYDGYKEVRTFEDLGQTGLRIGGLRAYFETVYVQSRFPNANIVYYASYDDLFAAADDKQVDVILATEQIIKDYLESYSTIKLISTFGPVLTSAIAVRFDDIKPAQPSRNQAPVVSNIQVYTSEVNQLTIRYDLHDDDEYNSVALYVSYTNTEDDVHIVNRLSGDIGNGVHVGMNRSFTWDHALSGKYHLHVIANDGLQSSQEEVVNIDVSWPYRMDDYVAECWHNAPYFLNEKANSHEHKRPFVEDDSRHVYYKPQPLMCGYPRS